MDKSLETNRSRAGSLRWLAVSAGTYNRDRTNYRAARLSFRQLFESAPDAMVLANSQGRIILVNAQTEHLFGYGREELIGRQLEMLMPERFHEGHSGHRALDVDLDLCGLRNDGSEFPVEISFRPVESDEGTLISAAIRDVSERKHIEELRMGLKFERLLSEISETFINLSPELVDGAIENCLKRLVEEFNVDRATLTEVDITAESLIATHGWDRPGIPPDAGNIVKDRFPWLFDHIRKGQIVCVPRPEELPDEAVVELEFMRSTGMKSTLVIPLLIEGKPAGALSIASLQTHQTWDAIVISRFQQAGNVFANALARKHAYEKLQAAYLQISVLKERLEQENVYLREEIKLDHSHTAVIGQSDIIRDVLKKAEQVAPTESAVLISGETGTGKELIARTIHELSSRKARPMVKVNCAAMPATLIESELFGREKGAYTGALSREIGRFELADRSTIFLDEIGEMPIELQAKLLRVLQDGEFERLGSSRTLHVDVRVIAATNRDLQAAVREGKFREDLYYRLSVFPIQVPPLRQRREDIPALVWYLLKDQCARMGRDVKSIHHATLKAFQQYSWPGNVRELRNLIERYLILNPGPVFRAEVPELGETRAPAGQQLDEVERLHILNVLQSTRFRIRGNGGAAEHLGLKPTTLEARMKKLGIVRPQWSIRGSLQLNDHTSHTSTD